MARAHWEDAGLETACGVLTRSTPRAKQLAWLSTKWGLDREQATCAMGALAVTSHVGRQQEEAWLRCVERWPMTKPFWVGLLERWSGVPSLDEPLARLSRDAPGGADLLQTLIRIPNGPQSGLARRQLEGSMERAVPLMEQRLLGEDARFDLALDVLDSRQSVRDEDWPSLARSLLAHPIHLGQYTLAARLWLEVPPQIRARLGAAPLLSLETCLRPWADDPTVCTNRVDLRPGLRLGLAMNGAVEAARALVLPRDGEVPLEVTLSDVLLDGTRPADTWELALTHSRGNQPLDTLLALSRSVAPHHLVFGFGRWLDEPPYLDPAPRLSERARTLLNEATKASHERLRAFVRDSGPSTTQDAGAPPPVTLADPPPGFVERASPWRGKAAVKAPLPSVAGFWPERCERVGQRLVVLAASQRYDPTGEVTPGGYWLLLGRADGPGWTAVYTGLPVHRPWKSVKATPVPLLDDQGMVRLVMDEAPLDDSSVTFPPVATRAPVKRRSVVLEAPLERLQRDTDGDGLTDLAEDRLLLDPMRPDTDGDGVKDGDDATPRLDDRLPATTTAEVLNAFLARRRAREPVALITTPGSPKPLKDARPRGPDLDDVTILEGTAATLAGLQPLTRVVTFSSQELDALAARYGTIYPRTLRVVVNGKQHAFIQWSAGWSGGSARVDRDETGAWVFTILSQWVT